MSHSIPRFRLGTYEPLLELASGGMATVYVARQLGAAGFERLVVLKRVHPHLLKDKDFSNMFRDEARLASLVRHPNVVSVVDVVENERELFLVMDYIESTSLASLQRRVKGAHARLPPSVATRIVADVLAGLHAAHEAIDMRGDRLEIVHRDVSPQNIVVGVDGASRLIDFGIAKAQNRLTETRSGSIKGKLGYLSPEGAHGRSVDRRADIFSAGVVLFEALTATRLFSGENDLDTLRKISEAYVPSAVSIVPDLPRAMDIVLERALARDPAHRYQSALEFLAAIERTIPPAPTRDVTLALDRFCGQHLADRRNDLRLRLEGKVDSVKLAPLEAEQQSGSGIVASGPITGQDATRVEGTEHRIATSHDLNDGRRNRSTLAVAAAVVVALGVFIAAAITIKTRAAHAPDAATVTPVDSAVPAQVASDKVPSPPAESAAAAKPSSGDVALTIIADDAIDSVHAKGLKHVDLDGKTAHLALPPWDGDLEIDVALAGGETAKVIATAKGPTELHAKPKKKSASTKTGPVSTGKKGELQENPYNSP